MPEISSQTRYLVEGLEDGPDLETSALQMALPDRGDPGRTLANHSELADWHPEHTKNSRKSEKQQVRKTRGHFSRQAHLHMQIST